MKVVILAGGFGTRIRDVAKDIPKPMIPIGPYPVLWHIMKYYACYGHTDFVLCLGYKSVVIKEFFLNYRTHMSDFTLTLGDSNSVEYHRAGHMEDWRITFVETGLNAMTGARIKRIQQHLGDDQDFLLTYGDGVSSVDLDQLVAFHRSHGKVLTVTGVRPPGRFGELVTDPEGRATEFNEKPQAAGGLISGGFFVCRKEMFDYLDDREDLVFEKEPMNRLVAKGETMVYTHDGFWQCMDTARDHRLLNDLFASGDAEWQIWK